MHNWYSRLSSANWTLTALVSPILNYHLMGQIVLLTFLPSFFPSFLPVCLFACIPFSISALSLFFFSLPSSQTPTPRVVLLLCFCVQRLSSFLWKSLLLVSSICHSLGSFLFLHIFFFFGYQIFLFHFIFLKTFFSFFCLFLSDLISNICLLLNSVTLFLSFATSYWCFPFMSCIFLMSVSSF